MHPFFFSISVAYVAVPLNAKQLPPTWAFRRIGGLQDGWLTSPHLLRAIATDAHLAHHPTRVHLENTTNAEFEIVCCLNKLNMRRTSKLNSRPIHRPYVVYTEGIFLDGCRHPEFYMRHFTPTRAQCHDFRALVAARQDFLYLMYDLLDTTQRVNDVRFSLPGVIWPPPGFWTGPAFPPTRQYKLTFRGTFKYGFFNSSTTRVDLLKNFALDAAMRTRWAAQGVVVDIEDRYIRMSHVATSDQQRFIDLMNSTFAIIPRGHTRWTARIVEALGAGSVLVVLSDGWRLPFDQLINWGKIAICLPEAIAQTPQLLIASLPTDLRVISEMREASLQVYGQYFSTFGRRWDAMLLAARAEVQRRLADRRTGNYVRQEDPPLPYLRSATSAFDTHAYGRRV